METTCKANLEKIVLNLLKCVSNEKKPDLDDIKTLVESLGFRASIGEKMKEGNEKVLTIMEKYMFITADNHRDSKVQDEGKEEKILNFIKTSENLQAVEVFPETKKNVKIEMMSMSPNIVSSVSLRDQDDVSVHLSTSSPIKENNHLADILVSKIMHLAKEAHDLTSNLGNLTFTKAPFIHRRISDIKISPLALNDQASITELNVTKIKDVPTLRTTPKRAVIVKPNVNKSTVIAAVPEKKPLKKPIQAKLLSAFQSKLRTPNTLRQASSTSKISRSAGAPSRLTASIKSDERRLSSTPQSGLRLPSGRDTHTPIGVSRIKYPTAIRK